MFFNIFTQILESMIKKLLKITMV